MAKILTAFPPRAGTERYPWADWFDGLPRLLEEGTDFTTATDSFRATAHTAARRYGLKVMVRRCDGGVALQSFRPTV